MQSLNPHARTAGLAACSAMALAMLAGCAGHSPLASAGTPAISAERADADAAKAIERMETRVAKSPRSASARIELARAYLAAGRFDSAAVTFEDAASLGDDTPGTALGMALAYIGSGRNAQALTVLERWHDRIPAADLGLAVALAGQPAQGVALLSDAVRGGDASPKARQNLAYAYALDGRWGEARVVAAQDVPADQIDARLSEWAGRAGSDQHQSRVAALLGVPVRQDPGQPVALALNAPETPVPMAAADTVEAPAEAPVPLAATELPAIDNSDPVPPSLAAWQPAPVPQHIAAPVAAKPVSRPQPMPAAKVAVPARLAAAVPQARGTHLVQLGSFSTRAGAKRAWTIFVARHPALKERSLRITEAQVRGRIFYRVAAEGFERGSAQSLCASVRQRGGGCFAYAESTLLPGKAGASPLLARR